MAEVLLSEAEKTYIIHGIQEDSRVDGRGCEDYRLIEVECDVVSNTNGSARVRLGSTDILAGIKTEMGKPKAVSPEEGCLEFFVDCSAVATPHFEGRGGDELATEIVNVLRGIFCSQKDVLDMKSLCVLPREICWIVYVDIVILQCGGNLFDAVIMAAKAALHATRVPKVSVNMDDEGQKEVELSDDPYDCNRINVDNVPCLVTVSKVGGQHIVDATMEEETCCLACLLVGVNWKGHVTYTKKDGSGSLAPESFCDMIESAINVAKVLNKKLVEVLEKADSIEKGEQTCFLY